MKKTILEAMKHGAIATLEGVSNELLAITLDTSIDKTTGDENAFVRCEVQVPKGCNEFSRCRFTVKIPEGKLKVTEEQLANDDFEIVFKNLEISFIDNRGNVYFRASDYSVRKEGA